MALTGLEAAALAASGGRVRPRSPGTVAADAVQRKAVVYDRQGDAHYDVISAFIKSHPRLRPRRRALLAGADARGGGGPALHRAADDRARVGGHRARRPAARCRSRRRRARRRARGAARGAAEPGGGGHVPGARAEVEQRVHAPWPRRWRTPRRPTPSRRTCATPSYPGAKRWATGRATVPARLSRAIRSSRSTVRSGSEDDRYYEPSGEGEDTS